MSFSSPFKNASGLHYTRALFLETQEGGSDFSTVLYTLKGFDHRGYPSLKRLFLETNDPTEYSLATTYLDGWDHWLKLCENGWFKPYLKDWRREMEVKLRSDAMVRILEDSRSGSKTSISSNRLLLDKGWVDKDTNPRGRPSKAEVNQRLEEEAQTTADIREAALRIGIVTQ